VVNYTDHVEQVKLELGWSSSNQEGDSENINNRSCEIKSSDSNQEDNPFGEGHNISLRHDNSY
jgi:hypothetical protein